MKKSISFLLLIILNAILYASPLHSNLKHTILIDTDCSIHDLRAVALLLSHPGITVKAILISEGQVNPDQGYFRITKLLKELQADTIPVIYGAPQKTETGIKEKENKKNIKHNFRILPPELLQPADTHLTFVCLGPLTNIDRVTGYDPVLRKRVKEVIWYIDAVDPFKGFNYEYDITSADQFLNSGIRVDAISSLNTITPIFNSGLLNQCKKSGTNISKALLSISALALYPEESGKDLSILAEEIIPLFLGNHELFELSLIESNLNIRYNTNYKIPVIKEVITDIIEGRYRSGHFIAFSGFPVDPELYVYDVRQILEPAISKYGIEEWKACTLTDEFHGHLGVFSIVGAKMGIRAREHFGIGTDLLEISSYAGTVEPFSCMNDGLQVSTGATLGQGSIHLINDTIARPQAIFTYGDRSIMLKLKDEYLKELKAVINRGVKNYGLQDEDYWNLIRQTSIKFWLEWDRNKIFDIVIL
ncbi:MAG TPA: nucleoside hydrolase [Bacteroidales bacterium]|nr:nucleoside hydrolase [Bacteroidales bacterium]